MSRYQSFSILSILIGFLFTFTSDAFSKIPGTDLYLKEMKKLKFDTSKVTFKEEKLPGMYHLPSAGPSTYANKFLIWAKDSRGRKLMAFRPINTTTGCNSGCTPIIFHLSLDLEGKTKSILEEKGQPLRKIYHQKMTDTDKTKLLKIAQNLPEALKWVEKPTQLTNSFTHFPPQTWTTYSDTLVKGGAYTTYRVFQAALTSYQFLGMSKRDKLNNQRGLQAVQKMLNSRPRSISELKQVISRIEKAISHPSLNEEAKAKLLAGLLTNLKHLAYYGSNKDLNLVKKSLNRKEYRGLFRFQYCEFLQSLLTFENGQKLLVDKIKETNAWPVCEYQVDSILPLLAAAELGKEDLVRKLYNEETFKKTPEFIKKDPSLLKTFIKATRLLGKDELFLKTLADMVVRYPLGDHSKVLKTLSPFEMRKLDSEKKLAEKSYREELARLVIKKDPAMSFPAIVGQRESGSIKLPFKGEKRQVYVFFASWCPHCKQTVKAWAENPKLGPSFWNSIGLIEVFAKKPGRAPVKEFCQATSLTGSKSYVCNDIVQISGSPKATKFYELINLTGVPRIILTDSKGKLAVFDYKIPHAPGTDFYRDILWLLEETKKIRK